MTIGENVRARRIALGLSQRDLARSCGLSNGTICFIENGRNPRTGLPLIPSVDTVKKLADFFGVSVTDLIMPPPPEGSRPVLDELTRLLSTYSDEQLLKLLDVLKNFHRDI